MPPIATCLLGVLAVLVTVAARPTVAANFPIPAGDTAAFAQAITAANANPDPDVITLAAGATYTFSSPTEGNNALPSITTAMTIEGNGSIIERPVTSAEDLRIFRLALSANLTLRNVIVQGGLLNGMGIAGAGMLVSSGQATIENSTFTNNQCNGGFGGAIYAASGPVVVRDSTIINNQAAIGGGVEVFSGTVTLERTAVLNNRAQAANTTPATGGGIALVNGGSITLTDVAIRGNEAQGSLTLDGLGGGLSNDGGACTLDRVTIEDNTATADGTANALGGGIHAVGNGPTFAIANSTIAGNIAFASGSGLKNGGGLYVNAVNSTSTLNNVTIALNDLGGTLQALPRGTTEPFRGGGIFLGFPGSVGTDSFTLSNTIVGDNESAVGPDCFTDPSKAILSGGHNLIENTSNCTFTSQGTDLMGQTPLLGAVADHGGFTPTLDLLVGSPAVNMGSDAAPGNAGACEVVDQRCFGRPAGGRCDIGAYEKDAVNACTTTTTTLPGCGVATATFASIECRLDALIAHLNSAADLGKFKKGLVNGATAARTRTGSAQALADTGKTKSARKKLKQAGKRLAGFLHRLGSNAARKKLLEATRTGLIDEGTPIRADLTTLGQSL